MRTQAKLTVGVKVRVTLATLALALAAAFNLTPPAWAFTYLCQSANYGFTCVSFSGYSGQSTWGYRVDSRGHNCTNYAAYRLARNGAANPGNLGNAADWDANARAKGFPVNATPTVGSIAQWEPYAAAGIYAAGHVAYVEAVTDSYIEVTDDNWGGTTARKKYFRGQSDWPSNFLHIKDVQIAPPPSQSYPQYVAIRQGSTVHVKSGLNDAWVRITDSATDIQVAGNRFAFRDANRRLWAKEGVSGTWYALADGVEEYKISATLVVIRQGNATSAKAGLTDMWVKITDFSKDLQVTDSRIGFRDGTNRLWMKEGIAGTWFAMADGVVEYRAT